MTAVSLEDQLFLSRHEARQLAGSMVRMIEDSAYLLDQALHALRKSKTELLSEPTPLSIRRLDVTDERLERTLDTYAATIRELKAFQRDSGEFKLYGAQ